MSIEQIHPDVALVPLMRRIVADDVHVHLYSNDFTPDKDTELADLDTFPLSGGYAVITVAAADFVLSNVSGHRGVLMALPVTFTFSNALGPAYGYYVTDTTDTDLLTVARFDGAPLDGEDGVTVWPAFGDSSLYP